MAGCAAISISAILAIAALAILGVVFIDGQPLSLLEAAGKLGLMLLPGDMEGSSDFDLARAEFHSAMAGYVSVAIIVGAWAVESIMSIVKQTKSEIQKNANFYIGLICLAISLIQLGERLL